MRSHTLRRFVPSAPSSYRLFKSHRQVAFGFSVAYKTSLDHSSLSVLEAEEKKEEAITAFTTMDTVEVPLTDEKSKLPLAHDRVCCFPVSREPSFPLKIRFMYFVLNTLFRFAVSKDGTLSFNRKFFSDSGVPPNPVPDADGVATSDHVVDPARNLLVRHFSPSSASTPLPVIVYFHGGGFVSSSAVDRFFDRLCRRMSSVVNAHVVSVEYRLAPEHRCPAPYDDGADVLRWLDEGDLIDDLSSVFIAGDSAGGNIAHHVAVRVAKESYRRLRPIGVVAIQPFFGGEEDTDSERRIPFVSRKYIKLAWWAFLPEGVSLDHEAANVFGPGRIESVRADDWSGYPDTMVVIGDWDPFQDRQRQYCEGLRKAGVKVWQAEYPHTVHAFFMFEKAGRERLLKEIGEFVRRRCEE